MKKNKQKNFQLISKKQFINEIVKNNKNWNLLNVVIFLAPIALFIYIIYLRFNDDQVLETTACEDCIVENIQAIFYLLSSALALILSIKNFKRKKWFKTVAYTLIFLGLFVWFMEEISWGQRLFDWESGKFFQKYNYQNETTLHNMHAFGFFLDRGFLYMGIIGCILCWTRIKKTGGMFLKFLNEIKPQPKHFSYFSVLTIIFYVYLTMRKKGYFWWSDNMNWRELEYGEMILAIAIFLILFETLMKNKRRSSLNG